MRSNADMQATSSVAPPPEESQRRVAAFGSYVEAQAAVDRLADAGFPVESTTITGEGLRYVERVTGRRGYAEAMLSGALHGAVIGAVLGFVFGLFDWVEPLVSAVVLAFYGAVYGAVLGGLLGLGLHWTSAGRRDFQSVSSVEAERYSVRVAAEHADEASRLLGGEPAGTGAHPAQFHVGKERR